VQDAACQADDRLHLFALHELRLGCTEPLHRLAQGPVLLAQTILQVVGVLQIGQARSDLERAERLAEKIVGAALQRRDLRHLVGAGGHHHDPRCRLRRGTLEGRADLPAVHARHHQVDQDQLRARGPCELEAGHAVRGLQHGVLVREDARQVAAHVGLVVDHEHVGARRRDQGIRAVRTAFDRHRPISHLEQRGQRILGVAGSSVGKRVSRAHALERTVRAGGGLFQRQLEHEGAALAQPAAHREPPSMLLGQLLGQR
jgi:hypothetical protein